MIEFKYKKCYNTKSSISYQNDEREHAKKKVI